MANNNKAEEFMMKITTANRKGIAMITVIMILLFMMLVAGMILKLLIGGSGVAGSSRRYLSVFEAAESGVEVGMLNIENAARAGTAPSTAPINVAGRQVSLEIEYIFTGTISGANIVFGGTGYEGVGTGVSSGGSAIYYRIESTAKGQANEQAVIETAYRKVIGINVR